MNGSDATVTIKGPNAMYVLRLVDQRLREVGSSGAGEIVLHVAPGVYTARCEAGGPAAEQTFRVSAGEERTIDFSIAELPRYESAAPVSGARNNNEHHSDYAVSQMAGMLDQKWKKGGVRLLLMNRRLTDDISIPVTLEGFSLISAVGALITDIGPMEGRFKDDELKDNITYGRDSFLLDLPPGGYVLCWPETQENPTDRPGIPIWLPTGDGGHDWDTFVFVAVDKGQSSPPPWNVSVHLSERRTTKHSTRAFGPGDRKDSKAQMLSSTATELALASLRTGRRQLSDETLWELLRDKFRNPMSGILGAYMLCERDAPNWELFEKVIRRLRELVPDHPDIQGLTAFAAKNGWKKAEGLRGVTFPPMLQVGATALSELDWEGHHDLVKPGSMAEIAALRWIKGGPWTLFGVPEAPAGPPAPAVSEPPGKVKEWLQQNIPGSQDLFNSIVSQDVTNFLELPETVPLRQLKRMGFSRKSANELFSTARKLLDAPDLDALSPSNTSKAIPSGERRRKATVVSSTGKTGNREAPLSKRQIMAIVKATIADQLDQLPTVSVALDAWSKTEFTTFTKKLTKAIPGLQLTYPQIKNSKTVGEMVKIVTNLQQ